MNTALLLAFIALLAWFRDQLIYRLRLRRIEAIRAEALAALNRGDFRRSWKDEYDRLPSYDSMLFDIRRWTYAQFFGAEQ